MAGRGRALTQPAWMSSAGGGGGESGDLQAGYGLGPQEPVPEPTRKELPPPADVSARNEDVNGSSDRRRRDDDDDRSHRDNYRSGGDRGRDRRDRRPSRSRSRDRKKSRRSRSRSPEARRMKRPSFWDMKDSPYGIPLPPVGGANQSASSPEPQQHAQQHQHQQPPPPQPRMASAAPQQQMPMQQQHLQTPHNPMAAAQAAAAALGNPALRPGMNQNMPLNELAATMAQPTYQATRHARRLYVGNLPADSTEQDVAEFFNKSMAIAGGVESPGNAVLSVYLNLDKRFAFIELRTMSEAAAALQMDGVLFRGMSLRMRRPNDYNPIAFPPVDPPATFNASLLGIVSTQVPDGPNKVFIGGIPYHLTEDQIKELLQSYGPLGAFNLIKDANTGLSKGYAFFEYQDAQIIDEACKGLNGMQVGDKTLTVRRANQQGGSHQNQHGHGMHGGPQQHGHMGVGGMGMGMGGGPPQVQMPTRVLELTNILTDEDLANDEEYEDICEDIKEECSKYGTVEEILVPRPSKEGEPAAQGVGKVFLRFSKPDESARTYASMVGRKFGGRPVFAKYFNEERFTKRELEGP